MYKIKNLTKGKILLFDLDLKLSSKEVVDLDSLYPRDKVESSTNLRVAIENELVGILHKDVIINNQPVIDANYLLDLEKRIEDRVKENLGEQTANPNQDVDKLTAQLSQLIDKMGNMPVEQSSDSNSEDGIYEEDEERMSDIHAKAIKRLVGKSQGTLKANKQSSESDISSRADELDEFLK